MKENFIEAYCIWGFHRVFREWVRYQYVNRKDLNLIRMAFKRMGMCIAIEKVKLPYPPEELSC